MKKKQSVSKLVAKKNALIPEFVKLGMQEKRFLAFCFAQINPIKEKELGRFTVNIAEIARVFDLPLTHTYPRIIEAAYAINSKPVLRTENNVRKMDFWFCWLDWMPDSGQIEVQFNERLVPFLLDLRKEYIQYPLAMTVNFTNRGWSLYEILKQWVSAGRKKFELDELKNILGLLGKYRRWSEFNRNVIKPAVENINNFSDITVKYTTEKNRRSISGVVFNIKIKHYDQKVIDIETPEEELYRSFLGVGINDKTAANYAHEINIQGKANIILAKLPYIIEIAGKNKNIPTQKYILGAVKNEILQQELPFGENENQSEKTVQECFHGQFRGEDKCQVRLGKSEARGHCKFCVNLYPVQRP